MFSANPSISSTGLKSLDVANGVGLGQRSRTGGERGRTRREWGQSGSRVVRTFDVLPKVVTSCDIRTFSTLPWGKSPTV